MDLATVIGIVVAFGAIIGGQGLEGGPPGAILQPTAAVIVLGGTLAAPPAQFPGAGLEQTPRALKQVFLPTKNDTQGTVATIVQLANKARREGLVAIEKEVSAIADPFLQRALEMAVDGTEARALRAALEIELGH